MFRPPGLEYPDALHHDTARGNRRESIFLNDADRLLFFDLLARDVRLQGWLRCA